MIASKSFVFRFADIEVREREFRLIKDGEVLPVEPKAFRVLLFLLHNPQRLIKKDELLDAVWNDANVSENSLARSVALLRRLLGDDIRDPRYIATVATLGYRFIAPVDVTEEPAEAPDEPSQPQPEATRYGLAEPALNGAEAQATAAPSMSKVRPFRWKIAIPAILLALTAAAFWYLRHPLPVPHVVSFTQITHDGHSKRVNGTDGSRIYFTELYSNLIAQVGMTGGEIVPLPISVPGYGHLEDISPDGSTALVVSFEGEFGYGHGQLWTSRIVGGSLRRLGEAQSAAFSPAGDSVIYSNREGEIYSVKSDGTGSRKLAALPKDRFRPFYWSETWATGFQLSPDGKVIRFQALQGLLYEMSADGSNLHPLLPDWKVAGRQFWGRWTPDGDFYLFLVSAPVYGSQLWALDERRRLFRNPPRDPIQLTSGPILWGRPIPSRDGNTIFASGQTLRGELSRYDAKTGKFQPYLGGISAESISFSNDRKSVAYVTYPEGILWKAASDGSNPVQLTDHPLHPYNPRWSPDDKEIVFSSEFLLGASNSTWDPGSKIYVVSSEGGSPKRLIPEGNRKQHDPNWSPDGQRILFGWELNRVGHPELSMLDLSNHQVSTVPGSAGLGSPRWSPDGRYIAALSAMGEAANLRVYDMTTQKWSAMETNGAVGWPAFSKNSQFIYFLRTGRDQGVFRIPVTGGREERIVDLKDLHATGGIGSWMALDPDDAPMILRDVGTGDIYALTLAR